MVTFTKGGFKKTRILQDLNGDGWCDLWCATFQRDADALSRETDSDSDGMTDYEEMVLMQDPDSPNPFPRNPTRSEMKEQSQRNAIRKAAIATSGASQKFSLVISGNQDPQPARPMVEFVNRIGWYVTLNVKGFVGVMYQLETSNDLVIWTKKISNNNQDFPEALVEDAAFFPLIFFHNEYFPPLYYRLRKSGGF